MIKKCKNYCVYGAAFLSCILLAGCFPRKGAEQMRNIKTKEYVYFDTMPNPKEPITILIHGTRLPPPLLFFVPPLASCVVTPPGFHHANAVGGQYFFAHMAKTFDQEDHAQFPLENFYLFGWSGKLSFRTRKKAGADVYQFLKKIKSLPEYKDTPITVITISHGGNVALSVGCEAAADGCDIALVDRLILLGCPVQDETEEYTSAPIFKKVFNIFSPGDMIQVADPQKLYEAGETDKAQTFFSRRTFSDSSVIQAEVRHRGRALCHADFAFSHFQKRLPRLLKSLEQRSEDKGLPVKIDLCELRQLEKIK